MIKDISPISSSERIISLDILRGFAIMGILIMNIQSFSIVGAAYLNPTAYGDFTGINKWTWLLSHVFADNKFMTIFSMLFGAGIVLMSNKIEEAGLKPAALHYRRMFWLLVIGLVHSYLFWFGDILTAYAMCGLIVFLFRKLKAGWLFFFGLLTLSVGVGLYLFFGMTIEYWPKENLDMSLGFWAPPAEDITAELNAYQGSFRDVFQERFSTSVFMQTMVFLINISWHAGGLMLIGMALYKWGILSGAKSKKFYTAGLIVGMGIGFSLVLYGIKQNFDHNWSFEYSMYIGSQFNYIGSIFISFAYISLIMLVLRSGILKWCQGTLSMIGRTALSNYLLQTLICTTIFYGYGFGIYGKIERWQMIPIVILVWLLQILLTRLWMRKYRFGPVEWIWRSLTYWKIQPIKK